MMDIRTYQNRKHQKFVLPALGHENLSHIVIGDFNSHNNTTWGNTNTENNGEAVEQWADLCNLTLIHNAKLSKSFNSEDGREATTPTPSLYLRALVTCAENQSWSLSLLLLD